MTPAAMSGSAASKGRARSLLSLAGALVCLWSAVSMAADEIKVIPEQATMYAQPSSHAREIGTLARGQTVTLDLTITNREGRWCLCRISGQKASGYVKCAELSGAEPKASSTALVTESSSAASGSAETAGDVNAGTKSESGDTVYEWMARLPMTDDQQRAIAGEYTKSGLRERREQLEALFRRYGIKDYVSMFDIGMQETRRPGSRLALESDWIVLPAAKRMRSFWQFFMNTFTPEQKKSLPPEFLLWYAHSQSEPDVAFFSYVLGHMARGGSRVPATISKDR